MEIIVNYFIVFLALLYRQKTSKRLNISLKEKVEEKQKELREINNNLELRIKKKKLKKI